MRNLIRKILFESEDEFEWAKYAITQPPKNLAVGGIYRCGNKDDDFDLDVMVYEIDDNTDRVYYAARNNGNREIYNYNKCSHPILISHAKRLINDGYWKPIRKEDSLFKNVNDIELIYESKKDNFGFTDYTKYIKVGQKFTITTSGTIAQIIKVSDDFKEVHILPSSLTKKYGNGIPYRTDYLISLLVKGLWVPLEKKKFFPKKKKLRESEDDLTWAFDTTNSLKDVKSDDIKKEIHLDRNVNNLLWMQDLSIDDKFKILDFIDSQVYQTNGRQKWDLDSWMYEPNFMTDVDNLSFILLDYYGNIQRVVGGKDPKGHFDRMTKSWKTRVVNVPYLLANL